MHKCCNYSNVVHYADDTTLFVSSSDLNYVVRAMNMEIASVDTWLTANRLSLNISKTKAVVISKMSSSGAEVVHIRGQTVDYVQCMNFLGVHLDKDLSFRVHGSEVIGRLSRSLGILRRLSQTIPPSVLLKLYYSIFYSHLTYALIVWGNCSVGISNRISSLQRQAVRLLKAEYEIDIDVFAKYSLMKFPEILKYFSVVKLYNVLNGNHQYFLHRINSSQVSHSYTTRQKDSQLLSNVYCRTSCSQQNFLYNSIRYWNDLPLHIRKSETLVMFKRLVRDFLLNK